MIEICNVYYQQVLEDFSLSVATGETLVLLGASGAGKSTALRLVNGLVKADRGVVKVGGVVAHDLIALRRNTGYVQQDGGLFPHLTVAQNIATVPELCGWDKARIAERVAELLNLVELPDYGSRLPHRLSGGQKQRVAVARALAGDPPVLLLDEPFSALDPLTRLALQQRFQDLTQGKTSIFVTHDLREAMRVGTRIALLDAGKIVALDAASKFATLDHPLVRRYVETLT